MTMKKQILFSAVLFFSAMRGMDQPVKQGKLLFSFPNKTVTDVWQMVRENWKIYQRFGEQFPTEINQLIACFLLRLNNPASFSTSEDQFFRKMLGCCITLWNEEREWKIPFCTRLTLSDDGNYYYGDVKQDQNSVYCAKTQSLLHSFNFKSCSDVFLKKRNIVIGDVGRAQYTLYDIATNKSHEIVPRIADYLVCPIKVSPSERYIAGISNGYLYVWDIADLDHITCKKYFGGLPDDSQGGSYIYFLFDDEYILYGNTIGVFALFAREDTELKKVKFYQFQLPVRKLSNQWYSIQLQQSNGDQYVLGVWGRSIGLKIEKDSEGKICLKKVFDMMSNSQQMFLGNECIVTVLDKGYGVVDYSGNILHQSDNTIASVWTHNDKYFLYNRKVAGKDGYDGEGTILHILRDKSDRCLGFEEYACSGTSFSSGSVVCNSQSTLLATELYRMQGRYVEQTGQIQCFDFQGNLLKSIVETNLYDGGLCINFHPNGRELLLDCKNGQKKKRILYPKDADDHFKKLAHKPLSLAHYAGLEKICSEVVKFRLLEREAKKAELS
jgi:hypothetical protein